MSDPNNRHPDSDFNAQYPYNQSTLTRSGHEIHINDSPGSESLKLAHRKGTYVEINQDGRWIQTVVEKGYNYYKDGLTETVDGHKDIKIAGNLNSNVDNSINDVVGGDRFITSGGTTTLSSGGARTDYIGDDMTEVVDGDKIASISGDHSFSVGGDQVSLVSGIKKDILGSSWQTTSGGDIEIINDNGVFKVNCNEFMIITPYGTITIGPDGINITGAGVAGVNFTATGPVAISGSIVNINELV
jgi:hypothetical protein